MAAGLPQMVATWIAAPAFVIAIEDLMQASRSNNAMELPIIRTAMPPEQLE